VQPNQQCGNGASLSCKVLACMFYLKFLRKFKKCCLKVKVFTEVEYMSRDSAISGNAQTADATRLSMTSRLIDVPVLSMTSEPTIRSQKNEP
jgi:hypothetical protein